MSARDRILLRVREALVSREPIPHPGPFLGWRPGEPPAAVAAFMHAFEAAGGEVLQVPDESAAAEWLRDACTEFGTATVGVGVPASLHPDLPSAAPDLADLGVSMARCAVAETGSLVLGAEDGRRTQILPPNHIVFVREQDILGTLRETLSALKPKLPSAVGLHSGPSKSADIGQILVKGVHGPGRVIAVVISTDTHGPLGT